MKELDKKIMTTAVLVILVCLCALSYVCCLEPGITEDELKDYLTRSAQPVYSPSCPYSLQFVQLTEAFNERQQLKKIAQNRSDQWFHTATCSPGVSTTGCQNCCAGVNPLNFQSECRTTKTLVTALLCKQDDPNCYHVERGWIYVDSGCTCVVSEIQIPE